MSVVLDQPSESELLAHLAGLTAGLRLEWRGRAAATLIRDTGERLETRTMSPTVSELMFAKAYARADPIWLAAWWYSADVEPAFVENRTSVRRLLN